MTAFGISDFSLGILVTLFGFFFVTIIAALIIFIVWALNYLKSQNRA